MKCLEQGNQLDDPVAISLAGTKIRTTGSQILFDIYHLATPTFTDYCRTSRNCRDMIQPGFNTSLTTTDGQQQQDACRDSDIPSMPARFPHDSRAR
jgi:hypothetical protein